MDEGTELPGDSREVTGQPHPRSDLVRKRLARHRAGRWRHPVAPDRAALIEDLFAQAKGRPIVCDTGCGTGLSSVALARANPEAWVLGLDKSEHRLAKAELLDRPDNVVFARVELADVWAVASRLGQRVAKTAMLYPNPWPKVGQLNRRLYGEPSFAPLVQLSDSLELRTNWEIFAIEFSEALHELTGERGELSTLAVAPQHGLTAFERKYAASGHVLYRVRATLR